MLVCNEALLQKFVSNLNALKLHQFNHGVKQFKGIVKNFGPGGLSGFSDIGYNTKYLLHINQYDMSVETLLYFDPMVLVQGNSHLNPVEVKRQVLEKLQRRHKPTKQYDKLKVWKFNFLDMSRQHTNSVLLSLHDIVHFYESELPIVMDLDKYVKMPNLIDLLYDYLNMMVQHRSIIGKIIILKLPQYKRPVNPKTGRMVELDTDSLYRMKVLDIYLQMQENVRQQQQFEDNNALPLSLDKDKKSADKTKLKLPKLSLRCKTIRERVMPIFENNSRQLMKILSLDMQVVV